MAFVSHSNYLQSIIFNSLYIFLVNLPFCNFFVSFSESLLCLGILFVNSTFGYPASRIQFFQLIIFSIDIVIEVLEKSLEI
jgi:hypothetical protein